jgi:hypothetical protein
MKKELLIKRLEELAKVVQESHMGVAFIGLGSVGIETDRLDDYSDLDFFVIAKSGCKSFFLSNLDWMRQICPIAYAFRNTDDGYKVLYEDQIFCEFAVFEAHDLEHIDYAQGRLIWKEEGFDESYCYPKKKHDLSVHNLEWIIGEILSNLYVGLCRYRRGEKLSAFRFIQVYPIDRIMELTDLSEISAPSHKDEFSRERRFEKRYPKIAVDLPRFMLGYDRIPESAREIIRYLDKNFTLNEAMKNLILELCDGQ